MQHFDIAYGFVFSHPFMVQLLLERHMPDWSDRLDFSTLDDRSTKVFDDNHAVVRHLDLLSRCKTDDADLDALVPMEVQGKPRKHMATRITVYAGLACQKERKRHEDRRETPPRFDTLKLVLFHGDGRWTASLPSWCWVWGAASRTSRWGGSWS